MLFAVARLVARGIMITRMSSHRPSAFEKQPQEMFETPQRLALVVVCFRSEIQGPWDYDTENELQGDNAMGS